MIAYRYSIYWSMCRHPTLPVGAGGRNYPRHSGHLYTPMHNWHDKYQNGRAGGYGRAIQQVELLLERTFLPSISTVFPKPRLRLRHGGKERMGGAMTRYFVCSG